MTPLLDGEVAVPAEAGDCLTPLRWLLGHVGDGVTLTQAGCLPKALVLEANKTFGWFELLGFKVRTETDLPELATLNERIAEGNDWRNRTWTLTSTGRQAALLGLQLQSREPRNHP